MGDQTSVMIQIGGELAAEHLDDFINAINGEGLTFEWGMGPDVDEASIRAAIAEAPGEPLALTAHDVNYGIVDEVTGFCGDHGLHFRLEWDAGDVYGPGGTVYRGKEGEDYDTLGIGTAPVINAAMLRSLGGTTAALAYLDGLAAPLPPLKIVEAATAAA